MHAYPTIVVFTVCLLLVAFMATGKEEGDSDETSVNRDRKGEHHQLKRDTGERAEGPAKRDPSEHIDEHLRGQELLDLYPVEIPDRFEKKK